MGLGTGLNTVRAHTMNREYKTRVNKSIYLGGDDDYLDCGDHADFSMTTGSGIANDMPFSVSGWVKASGAQNYGFVSKAIAESGHHEYRAFMISGKMYFDLCTNTNINYKRVNTSSSHSYSNTWVHYVLTYNGDATDDSSDGAYVKNGMSIYVNGVKQSLSDGGSGSYDGMNDEASNLTWGFLLSDTTYDLLGWMADLALWKGYALTAENVRYLFAAQPDGNYSVDPSVSANSGLYSIEAADACKLFIPADAMVITTAAVTGVGPTTTVVWSRTRETVATPPSVGGVAGEAVMVADGPPASPSDMVAAYQDEENFEACREGVLGAYAAGERCWRVRYPDGGGTYVEAVAEVAHAADLETTPNTQNATLVSSYSLSSAATANSPTLNGVGVINTLP